MPQMVSHMLPTLNSELARFPGNEITEDATNSLMSPSILAQNPTRAVAEVESDGLTSQSISAHHPPLSRAESGVVEEPENVLIPPSLTSNLNGVDATGIIVGINVEIPDISSTTPAVEEAGVFNNSNYMRRRTPETVNSSHEEVLTVPNDAQRMLTPTTFATTSPFQQEYVHNIGSNHTPSVETGVVTRPNREEALESQDGEGNGLGLNSTPLITSAPSYEDCSAVDGNRFASGQLNGRTNEASGSTSERQPTTSQNVHKQSQSSISKQENHSCFKIPSAPAPNRKRNRFVIHGLGRNSVPLITSAPSSENGSAVDGSRLASGQLNGRTNEASGSTSERQPTTSQNVHKQSHRYKSKQKNHSCFKIPSASAQNKKRNRDVIHGLGGNSVPLITSAPSSENGSAVDGSRLASGQLNGRTNEASGSTSERQPTTSQNVHKQSHRSKSKQKNQSCFKIPSASAPKGKRNRDVIHGLGGNSVPLITSAPSSENGSAVDGSRLASGQLNGRTNEASDSTSERQPTTSQNVHKQSHRSKSKQKNQSCFKIPSASAPKGKRNRDVIHGLGGNSVPLITSAPSSENGSAVDGSRLASGQLNGRTNEASGSTSERQPTTSQNVHKQSHRSKSKQKNHSCFKIPSASAPNRKRNRDVIHGLGGNSVPLITSAPSSENGSAVDGSRLASGQLNGRTNEASGSTSERQPTTSQNVHKQSHRSKSKQKNHSCFKIPSASAPNRKRNRDVIHGLGGNSVPLITSAPSSENGSAVDGSRLASGQLNGRTNEASGSTSERQPTTSQNVHKQSHRSKSKQKSQSCFKMPSASAPDRDRNRDVIHIRHRRCRHRRRPFDNRREEEYRYRAITLTDGNYRFFRTFYDRINPRDSSNTNTSASARIPSRVEDAVPSTSTDSTNAEEIRRINSMQSNPQVNRPTGLGEIYYNRETFSIIHNNGLNNAMIPNRLSDQNQNYFRGDIISTNFDVMDDCQYSRYLNAENRAIRRAFDNREIVVIEDGHSRQIRVLRDDQDERGLSRRERRLRRYNRNRLDGVFALRSEDSSGDRDSLSSRPNVGGRAHERRPDRSSITVTRHSEVSNNNSGTLRLDDDPNLEGPSRPRKKRRAIRCTNNNNSNSIPNNSPLMSPINETNGRRSEDRASLLRERHTSKHPYRMRPTHVGNDERPVETVTERNSHIEMQSAHGETSNHEGTNSQPENNITFQHCDSDGETSVIVENHSDDIVGDDSQNNFDRVTNFPPVRNPLTYDEVAILHDILPLDVIKEINSLVVHALNSVLYSLYPDVESDGRARIDERTSIRIRAQRAIAILARTARSSNTSILDVLALEYVNYYSRADPSEPSTSSGRRTNPLADFFNNGHLILILQVIKERHNRFLRSIINDYRSNNTLSIQEILENHMNNNSLSGVAIMLQGDRFEIVGDTDDNTERSRLLYYGEEDPSRMLPELSSFTNQTEPTVEEFNFDPNVLNDESDDSQILITTEAQDDDGSLEVDIEDTDDNEVPRELIEDLPEGFTFSLAEVDHRGNIVPTSLSLDESNTVYISCEPSIEISCEDPTPSTSRCNTGTEVPKKKREDSRRPTRSDHDYAANNNSDRPPERQNSSNKRRHDESDNVQESNSNVDVETPVEAGEASSGSPRIGLRGNMEEWYGNSLRNYEPLLPDHVTTLGNVSVVNSGDNNLVLADNNGLGTCYVAQRRCEGIEPCDLPLNAEVVNPLLYNGPSYEDREFSDPEDFVYIDNDGNLIYCMAEMDSEDDDEDDEMPALPFAHLNDRLANLQQELINLHSIRTRTESEDEDNAASTSSTSHEQGCGLFQGLCMCRNSSRNLLSYLQEEFSIEREAFSSLDENFILMILNTIRSQTRIRGPNEERPQDFDTTRRLLRRILRIKRWLRLAERN